MHNTATRWRHRACVLIEGTIPISLQPSLSYHTLIVNTMFSNKMVTRHCIIPLWFYAIKHNFDVEFVLDCFLLVSFSVYYTLYPNH